MTNENAIDDVTASAQERLEDVKDSVRNFELSPNQKLLVTGVAAVVASTIIQKIVKRFRAVQNTTVNIDEVVVVTAEEDDSEVA